MTDEQLSVLDQTKQVRVVTQSPGGPRKTIIWIVVADGSVYIRSVDGETGRWYQRALSDPNVAIETDGLKIPFRAVSVTDSGEIETVSRALQDKYPAGGSLDRMVRDEVLATTLRLEPVTSQS